MAVAGKDLRAFYYPSGWPLKPYNPTGTTVAISQPAASLYLDQRYNNIVLDPAQIPLITSSGNDTISATTSASTTAAVAAVNNSFGFRLDGAIDSTRPVPELQLNRGNDSLIGKALVSRYAVVATRQLQYADLVGIDNQGRLFGGLLDTTAPPQSARQLPFSGADSLNGSGAYRGLVNGASTNSAVINLGDGNDTIIGSGGRVRANSSRFSAGLVNHGLMVLGVDSLDTSKPNSDRDALTGTSAVVGVVNRGTIDCGVDNDILTARGGVLNPTQIGLLNQERTAVIRMGDGNDTITANGYTAIDNSGTIDLGGGDASVTATGVVQGLVNNADAVVRFNNPTTTQVRRTLTASGTSAALRNNGLILFDGPGIDSIVLSKGGFDSDLVANPFDPNPELLTPQGRIVMGQGVDKITGFGTAYIDAGNPDPISGPAIPAELVLPANSTYALRSTAVLVNRSDPTSYVYLADPNASVPEGYNLDTVAVYLLIGLENAVGRLVLNGFTKVAGQTFVASGALQLTVDASGEGSYAPLPVDFVWPAP